MIVQAESSEDILHIVAAGAGGFVGVSGAVGVTLINSNTLAEIMTGAKINTLHQGLANVDQSVYVNAVNDAHVQTYMIGIAGGFVGVAGAVDVGTLNNNVTAQVDSGATVDALDNVEVNAVGLKNLSGFDISGAGGFVGVGGAVSVWAIGTQIQQSTQNQNGDNTGSATEDENGESADGNAGTQAQSASGTVTSGNGSLGNFTGGSGNSNTSQSRVQSRDELRRDERQQHGADGGRAHGGRNELAARRALRRSWTARPTPAKISASPLTSRTRSRSSAARFPAASSGRAPRSPILTVADNASAQSRRHA